MARERIYISRVTDDNVRKRFRGEKRGATAIEYGLLASLIGVSVILSFDGLGTETNSTFSTVTEALNTNQLNFVTNPNLTFNLVGASAPVLAGIFNGFNAVSKNSFQNGIDRLDVAAVPIGASLSFDSVDNSGNTSTYTLQKDNTNNRYSVFIGQGTSSTRVGRISAVSSNDYYYDFTGTLPLGVTHATDG